MYLIVAEHKNGKVISECRASNKDEASKKIDLISNEYPNAFMCLLPEGDAKDWVVDAENETVSMLINLNEIIEEKQKQIYEELDKILKNGVFWRESTSSSFYNISITPNMRQFLADNAQVITRGGINPHNGILWQDDTLFSIDDDGIAELAEFSWFWGLKMSLIAKAHVMQLFDMTEETLKYFNPNSIDWTVRSCDIGSITIEDWTTSQISQGWFNNTITQTP